MKLIAKKPCSFNGQTFYIGDEIPSAFVINPKAQEKLGTIAIVSPGDTPGADLSDITAEVGQVEFSFYVSWHMLLFCFRGILIPNSPDSRYIPALHLDICGSFASYSNYFRKLHIIS